MSGENACAETAATRALAQGIPALEAKQSKQVGNVNIETGPGSQYVFHDRDASAHRDILREVSDSARAGVAATTLGTTQTITQVGESTRAILSNLCDSTRDTVESINRNGSQNLSATERNGGDGRLTTERAARDTQRDVCGGFGELKQLVVSTGCKTDDRVSDGFRETFRSMAEGFRDSQVAVVGGFKDAARDAAINTASLSDKVCGFEGRAAVAATDNTYKIMLQAQGFESLAQARHAATLAAIEKCCCEQRELTRAEAAATRDLINSTEKDRVARELQDCKQEAAILRMQASLGRPGGGPGPFAAAT